MKLQQPIVDWFHKEIGLELHISQDCAIQKHPQKTTDTISVYLLSIDSFTFHLFHSLVHSTKSVVTALALWHNAVTIDDAVASVLMEEQINESHHGSVDGSHDLRKLQTYCDISSAAVLIQVSGIPPPRKETLDLFGDSTAILKAYEEKEWKHTKTLQDKLHGRLQEYIKKK